MDPATATVLVDAIRDASFPESEEILSSEIVQTNISPLLTAIESARNELSESVRVVSRQEAGDVDGWIEQAKRVQADIARCKDDARQIVQEHQRIELLRDVRNEVRSKSGLLQDEISFNETLEKQILLISDISAALSSIDGGVEQQQLFAAAQTLPRLAVTINKVSSDQSRSLLLRIHASLGERVSRELKQDLNHHFLISTADNEIQLQILQESLRHTGSTSTENSQTQADDLSLEQILKSIESLGLSDEVTTHLSRRIDTALLPHLYRRSKLKISGGESRNGTLFVKLSSDTASAISVVSTISQVVRHLHNQCPASVRESLVQNTLVHVIPLLVSEWLDPAIPTRLDQLGDLTELQHVVTDLDSWLRENGYRSTRDLQSWVKDIPKTWLSKRRTVSLDAVRKAFKRASGSTRLVERIERQMMNGREPHAGVTEDDWDSHWGEDDDNNDNDSKTAGEVGDDGSDAWGFDTEDQDNKSPQAATTVPSSSDKQDDEGEAWGWGDDDDSNPKEAASKTPRNIKLNGTQSSKTEEKDIVLKESYTVTDIPDYIIEQLGKDMADNQLLLESPTTYFKASTTPPPGLASLPALTLAMFRAIATVSYQSEISPPLSNMHIYNDTLYLASKLGNDSNDANTASSPYHSALESEVPALEKFARQAYTSELSIHRTILLDLLDTAQGFVSCTRSPYTETCETAITATTEHLRSLYAQWSSILSSSHLCQSIGSLLNSIMRKIIEDIEDMEDISEPESRMLLSLCEPVSALQDLFVVRAPLAQSIEHDAERDDPVSTIALHCTSYLRFQYLQQILESNLVEIRYLWNDAGLSLEFQPDEVVDLIKALFSESPQRRSAIGVIKSSS